MAGLPKKYAQMGFKRGWAAYKGQRRTTSKKTNSGVRNMAKKRYSRRSSGSFGSNKLMTGLYKPSGLIANVIMGVGAAALASKVPLSVPYKQEIAAGVVGGIPGAAAVFLLKGMNSGASNDSDLVTGY